MSEPTIGQDEEISYDTLLSRAKAEFGKTLSSIRKKTWATADQMESWRAKVAKADRAQSFIAGEFWRKDLEPFLRAESRIKPWSPSGNSSTIENAATEYLWKSGVSYFLEAFEKKIYEWIAEGIKARQSLADEAEKRKVLTPKH